ncbi:kinase-like domain-containing protein [Naematelia encephala]|uniref:Kinase-like domain-containing protein n=1 Tax=Naematelia encephala TaxID=71784 RepID=A0A1Y2AYF1_9TREE|nr:kinase-like domain-containing protein [Naematelia encephala]
MSHKSRAQDPEDGELPEESSHAGPSRPATSRWVNPFADNGDPPGASSSKHALPPRPSKPTASYIPSPTRGTRPDDKPREPSPVKASPVKRSATRHSPEQEEVYRPLARPRSPRRDDEHNRRPRDSGPHYAPESARQREFDRDGRPRDRRYEDRSRAYEDSSANVRRPRYDRYEPGRYDDDRRHARGGDQEKYRPSDRRGEADSWRPEPPRREERRPMLRPVDSFSPEKKARSPPRRRRTPTPEPEEEDGEIKSDTPPRPDTPPPLSESQTSDHSYRPIKIKNRPTRTASTSESTRPHSPSPPPPPPPEDDAFPPPPPPGSPPRSVPETLNPYTPVDPITPDPPKLLNRAIETAKSQAKLEEPRSNGNIPVPPAPNRNLLEPPTRTSTPIPTVKSELRNVDAPPQVRRQLSREEELERLGKSFDGTSRLDAYDVGVKLGEGTFGVVTKGVQVATKRAVALKKLITHNPRDGVSVTTIREIKILKSLDHSNVVPILDMVVQPKTLSTTGRHDIFMVFPYMDHDLCGLLKNEDFKPSHSLIKLLFHQILEGMAFIHANGILHRDIKTANILVDRHGAVMIADFGLARHLTREMDPHTPNEYTNMVVTRWYRAPELLLGDIHYGPAIDMWSLGCVLGEMYHREPILMGESDRDQLFKIFGHCGSINQDSFPGWDRLPGFPDSKGFRWDRVEEGLHLYDLAQRYNMDRGAADLMVKLLTLDPAKRLSAVQAMDHDWFFVAPLPATIEGTTINVDSSHEMTTKRKNEKAPPRQAQPPPNFNPYNARPPAHGPPAWSNRGHHPQAHGHGPPGHGPPMQNRPPHGYPPPPNGAYPPGPGPGPGNFMNHNGGGGYPPPNNGFRPPNVFNNRPPAMPMAMAMANGLVNPGPNGVPPPPFTLGGGRANVPQAPFPLSGKGPSTNVNAGMKRPGPPLVGGGRDDKRARGGYEGGLPW